MKVHSSVPVTKQLPPAAGTAGTHVFPFLCSQEPSQVPVRLLYRLAEVCSFFFFYLENFKGPPVYFPICHVMARVGYMHRWLWCTDTSRFARGPQHRNAVPWDQG